MLLAARNGLAPVQAPLTFGLVFWAWIAAAYMALGLGLALCVWSIARLASSRRASALALRAASLACVGGLVFSNQRALGMLFRLDGPERFRFGAPAALLLGTLGLLLLGWLGFRRAWPWRAATVAAAGCALFALAPEAWLPGAPPGPRGPLRHRRVSSLPPLLVVGLDGADWTYAEPLIARGDLPHLAALRARGAWGPLHTQRPTLSPAIWTTIATGKPPAQHGITGFTVRRLEDIDETLPDLHPVRGSGFMHLHAWLEARRRIRRSPIASYDRRAAAFWELSARAGAYVGVVNWWGTWPAEAVPGYVVSERAYYHALRGDDPAAADRLAYPPDLYPRIAPLFVRPEQVALAEARRYMQVTPEQFAEMRRIAGTRAESILSEFSYFVSMFESNRRVALDLLARGRSELGTTPDLLLLFRLVDKTCHTSLHQSELVGDHLGASPEELRRFGGVVSEAYRAVDRALGELVAACGECNVVVLSDHGFRLEDVSGRRKYSHMTAPDGIFAAAGPDFAAGRFDGLSVVDMLPLWAYLKGLPVADDLAGRLPAEVLRPATLESRPPSRGPSYGASRASEGGSDSPDVDEEMLERLRALGYLK
jgi:hypothetical protein